MFPVVHETTAVAAGGRIQYRAWSIPWSARRCMDFYKRLWSYSFTLKTIQHARLRIFKVDAASVSENIRAGTETELTRVLVHTMEELFARQPYGIVFTLEEIENHPKLFDRASLRLAESEQPPTKDDLQTHLVEIHNNTIRQFADVHSIGEFAQRCIAVLTYMFEHSTASMHPLFRQYAEKIISLLQEVPPSHLGSKAFTEPSGYPRSSKIISAARMFRFPERRCKGCRFSDCWRRAICNSILCMCWM